MGKRGSFKISNRFTDRSSLSFTKYLADISSIDMFTTDEEYECAVKAATGDRKAKEELVTRNLRFVVSVAKSYVRKGVSLEDLVNEGNYGLIMAAEKFDPTMGNKFFTYAVWWIRRYVVAYSCDNSTTIRIPINKSGAITKLRKRLSLKEQELSRPATYEDLINDVTTPHEIEVLENLIKVSNISVTSMDTPLDLGDGTGSMYEIIADDSFGDADHLVTGVDIKKMVSEGLSKLRPLDARVIIRRYGLDGRPPMTLAECGEEPDIAVSRERVRQIEKRAFRELRHRIGKHSLETV